MLPVFGKAKISWWIILLGKTDIPVRPLRFNQGRGGQAECLSYQTPVFSSRVPSPDSCREFLGRSESKPFVEPHRAFVSRRNRERHRGVAPEPKRLQRSFHQPAAEPAPLVTRDGADLRGVADARGDTGIQDDSGEMVRVRRPKDK